MPPHQASSEPEILDWHWQMVWAARELAPIDLWEAKEFWKSLSSRGQVTRRLAPSRSWTRQFHCPALSCASTYIGNLFAVGDEALSDQGRHSAIATAAVQMPTG